MIILGWKKFLSLLFCIITIYQSSVGQSPLTTQWNFNPLIARYEIISGQLSSDVFTSVKPYRRDAIYDFAQKIKPNSSVDDFNKRVLLQNQTPMFDSANIGKGVLKYFYRHQNALLHVSEPNFSMIINPVLDLSYVQNSGDSLYNYRNTRGAEIFGTLGKSKKLGFYTLVSENQVRFPHYMREEIRFQGVVKGTTLHKSFKTEGRDFFNARGYVTYSPLDEVMLQFGHDNNFFGNGFRSLILSDVSAPPLFLKINTKVWRLNYQNLFMQMSDFYGIGEAFNNPVKYAFMHHFSINVSKNLNFGIFENIIVGGRDSFTNARLNANYLNPIIFLRAVEHGQNSLDNAVAGIDWKWNFLNRFSFYGQFVLDEFIKEELFGMTESWVNKWASQFGLRYINVLGVNNLDLHSELNVIRPYIYQHFNASQNWNHYNQPMAHTHGGNLRELIVSASYQPFNRWTIDVMANWLMQGRDSSKTSANYGGDYNRTYNQRPATQDVHPIGDGIPSVTAIYSVNAHYMWFHNLFIDLGFYYRAQELGTILNDNHYMIHLGFRMNTTMFNYRN
jgi:hypothetical protein